MKKAALKATEKAVEERNKVITLHEARNYKNIQLKKTKDFYTNRKMNEFHPLVRVVFNTAIFEAEQLYDEILRVPNSGGKRLKDDQNTIYGKGRTKHFLKSVGVNPEYAQPNSAIRTNAKWLQSYHNYGLAIDLVMLEKNHKDIKKYCVTPEIASVFKKYGCTWGGDWGWDKAHFQLTFGYTWQQLKIMYLGSDIDSDGYIEF